MAAGRERILVTGGSGFIGQYVSAELLRRGYEPLIFDTRREPDQYPHFIGDIRDATALTEAAAHAEGFIHLAGVLGTQETIANPRPAAETNVLGGLNVLEAACQYNLPVVNIAVGNWFENNTYSITKSTVERFVQMYGVNRGLRATTVRALNAYGPRQSVAAPYGHSKVRKIMPSFISRALHGEPIEVYGDGRQIMDMIYVADVARVLVRAFEFLQAGDAQPDQIFSAGTGRRTSVLEIAEVVRTEIARQTGEPVVPVRTVAMRKGETPGVEVVGQPATLVELGIDDSGFTRLERGVANSVTYYRSKFGK